MKGKLVAAGCALALLAGLIIVKSCRGPEPQPDPPNPELPGVTVTRDTYTPPIVKLPFVKSNLPVPEEKLPIPPADVAASVVITPPDGGAPTQIIVSKQGELIPVAAPRGATITITKWRAPLISIGHHFSLGVVYCEKPALVLSYNPIRIWRFRIGLDAGAYADWKTAFAGASIKFHALTIQELGVKIHAVAGYEAMKRIAYVGGAVSL